eukprot:357442-Chlamydomonas_euryale.AAC.2
MSSAWAGYRSGPHSTPVLMVRNWTFSRWGTHQLAPANEQFACCCQGSRFPAPPPSPPPRCVNKPGRMTSLFPPLSVAKRVPCRPHLVTCGHEDHAVSALLTPPHQ